MKLLIDAKATLGEGPIWDYDKKVLYWIDIMEKEIFKYEPESETTQKVKLDQYIGSMALRENGGFILALQNGLHFYDWDSALLEKLTDPESHLVDNRFNDGKCDAAGRFWAGTMHLKGEAKKGALYVVDENISVSKQIENVSISNGLAWSPDNRFMYFIDTPTRQVVQYKYDIRTGKIEQPQVVVTFSDNVGFPDGMTIDQEGMLWIAHWGGSGISRWNPLTGKQLDFIPVPAVNVTSCTFGGNDLNNIYITTARTDTSEKQLEKYPHAGGIFTLQTNVKGSINYKFNG